MPEKINFYRIVFRKRYSKSVLILILLLVSSLIFASSLTSNSKIHIEGFKSQKIEKDHLIKIDSLWADISPTLKTQRLYGVQIEVETPFEILKMNLVQIYI